MKKIVFTALVLLTQMSLLAQTINISTGLASVGSVDSNWQLAAPIPSGATTSTYVVNSYAGYWQSTPIAGTNARWINPKPTLGTQTPGIYIFERNFTLASDMTLSYNLSATADDVLKSVEIVRPNGTAIPLTVVPTTAYNLSRVIEGSIKCAEKGNWKIRATVEYMDQLGGLLVSGNVILTQGSCCDCGTWEGFQYKLSQGNTRKLEASNAERGKRIGCNQTIVIKKGSDLVLNPLFTCSNAKECAPTYKAILVNPSGVSQAVNSFPYNFNQSKPGYYTLNVQPTCGNKTCPPCVIRIFVTPGCEGDIIETDAKDVEQINSTMAGQGRG